MKATRLHSFEITGGKIAKMLSRRFGAGFHNPTRNGLYWRAARLAAGSDPFAGRFGRDQLVTVVGLGRRSFLAEIQRCFAGLC